MRQDELLVDFSGKRRYGKMSHRYECTNTPAQNITNDNGITGINTEMSFWIKVYLKKATPT